VCATQWTGELECARTGRRLCKCATQAGVQAGRQAGACEQACRQADKQVHVNRRAGRPVMPVGSTVSSAKSQSKARK